MKIDTRTAVAGVTLMFAAGPLAAGAARAQTNITLPEIEISQTPVPTAANAGIDINKVPADVSTVTAHDFEVQYKPSVTDAITARVPGAIAINVDGSDLSPDLFYRGFDTSRISGTSEGLAVYENGVRINEAFGDLVNLDLIPPIAIARSDIYTNNPIFGLNALGGAINFTTKNGFTFHGGDFTILGGSYGRVNGYGEFGKQVGNYSFYVALDGYRDGGYRPFGAQNAERAIADLGYRSLDSEVHFIGQYGRSLLGVQGVTPQVLVNKQYNAVFTTPQSTENQAGLAQMTGSFDVGHHWIIGTNAYVRQFDQYHVDGNDGDVENCADLNPALGNTLCLPPDDAPSSATPRQLQFIGQNGKSIASLGDATDATAYGTTAKTATHTTSEGAQLQAVNKDTFYGHDNYFVAGASVDNSDTHFSSTTSLGLLNTAFQNQLFGVPGAGDIINTRGNVGFNSSFVSSNATYIGVFALDTFNVTKALAITAGARGNIANISLTDLSGSNANLDSMHNYDRINPVFGATYTFSPALTVYAGYSEANRAPTPLESECSNKYQPCILETALVSDPPLKQVVSHTEEAGVRGFAPLPASIGGGLAYKAGYFRTESDNDIVSEPSALSGQGFFVNAPETLRQGVEAGIIYDHGPWDFYANYAYIDARYEFSAKFASPNNPFANANGNIFVHPGDVIPGIPSQLGKLGLEYHVTPKWIVAADTILVGSQYFVGDDSNQNPKLPFYNVLNFHTSYQVTKSFQVFGIVNNVTDRKYATYGTYYDTGTDAANVSPTLAANANARVPNADAVTVAQPLSFYGGVKVTF